MCTGKRKMPILDKNIYRYIHICKKERKMESKRKNGSEERKNDFN